jgi:hypothetical protein
VQGGALYVSGESIGLRLIGCRFDSCSNDYGGAVFMTRGRPFSMNGTVGFDCTSDTFNGFCYVVVWPSAVDIRESSVSGCPGTDNTLVLNGKPGSGILCSVVSLNAWANNADDYGSTLAVWDFSPVAFHSCAFCGNWPRNCLEFGAGLAQEDISCLRVLNNSCQSSRTAPGLFCVAAELTVSKCLFRATDSITSSGLIRTGREGSRSWLVRGTSQRSAPQTR